MGKLITPVSKRIGCGRSLQGGRGVQTKMSRSSSLTSSGAPNTQVSWALPMAVAEFVVLGAQESGSVGCEGVGRESRAYATQEMGCGCNHIPPATSLHFHGDLEASTQNQGDPRAAKERWSRLEERDVTGRAHGGGITEVNIDMNRGENGHYRKQSVSMGSCTMHSCNQCRNVHGGGYLDGVADCPRGYQAGVHSKAWPKRQHPQAVCREKGSYWKGTTAVTNVVIHSWGCRRGF
jgi:hypothetical protein